MLEFNKFILRVKKNTIHVRLRMHAMVLQGEDVATGEASNLVMKKSRALRKRVERNWLKVVFSSLQSLEFDNNKGKTIVVNIVLLLGMLRMIEYSGTTPSTCVTIENRYSIRSISVISMCIHTYDTYSFVYGMCTVLYRGGRCGRGFVALK